MTDIISLVYFIQSNDQVMSVRQKKSLTQIFLLEECPGQKCWQGRGKSEACRSTHSECSWHMAKRRSYKVCDVYGFARLQSFHRSALIQLGTPLGSSLQ